MKVRLRGLQSACDQGCAKGASGFAATDKENEEEIVRRILVVQVEDGSKQTFTRSPLSDVVRVVERHTGPLAVNEIVHCFQDETGIQAGGLVTSSREHWVWLPKTPSDLKMQKF